MPRSLCATAREDPDQSLRAPSRDHPPGGLCGRLRAASDRGQASVELVVLLPVIAMIALGVWQVAIAGHALWAAGAAARAAARAEAVGADPVAAARGLLPKRVRRAAEVRADEGGEVRVQVPIPAVVAGGTLFTTTARARFEPQR